MGIGKLTPVAVFWDGDVPHVELRDLGDVAFTDAFFDRSVARAAPSDPVVLPVPEVCRLVWQRDDLLTPRRQH